MVFLVSCSRLILRLGLRMGLGIGLRLGQGFRKVLLLRKSLKLHALSLLPAIVDQVPAQADEHEDQDAEVFEHV